MDFNTYQKLADLTAVYPGKGATAGLPYSTLGLASEAGEVAGKVKKWIRGDNVILMDLRDELGDVLWYCAAMATDLGISLEDIADRNLQKLQSRKERGVLKGSGDNR